MGLAVMVELPMVICNIQRGGPSTGLPTKTEQADLFQAVYGRNGEAPMPVIAAASPADCFETTVEACRVALKYMTPVMLLSDGSLANGTEPWHLPKIEDLPKMEHHEVTDADTFNGEFHPYSRDEATLARPWARLGTPGLEHRIGGLEKEHITGGVCYDPQNHEFMIRLRAAKVDRVQAEIPKTEILGDPSGDLLLIGWGSTRGVIHAVTDKLRAAGKKVSAVHLRWINPLPPDLGDIIKRFKTVACPEMNMGQLATVLRSTYLADIKRINKVQGVFFMEGELIEHCERLLSGEEPSPFLIDTLELLTGDKQPDPQTGHAGFARFQ
jgi:2-oxoglutarate ferredoxin oxidoreductase subunit alpha